MGKCDFQALPIHVYPRSSRRERRCCCFSCWFLPAAGKERERWEGGGGRGGPRGTEPQEMSGYLLRGCFPPAVMECGTSKNCVFPSIKFTSWSLNWVDRDKDGEEIPSFSLRLKCRSYHEGCISSGVEHEPVVRKLQLEICYQVWGSFFSLGQLMKKKKKATEH